MATEPLSFRLEPELALIVDQQAKMAGQAKSTYLAAIVESHLSGQRNGLPAPSDKFLERHHDILQRLEFLIEDSKALNFSVGQKEQEASRDFAEARKQIDSLRSDIATLFAAALESFAGVERENAIAFTQTYMYPPAGRR